MEGMRMARLQRLGLWVATLSLCAGIAFGFAPPDWTVVPVDSSGTAAITSGSMKVNGNIAVGAAASGGNPVGVGLSGASGNLEYARSANVAAATTGTGLLGAGLMGFDTTNYQKLLCDTSGCLRTGSHTTSIKVASTIQAAAYAANDLVGGKQTITSPVRLSGGSGKIRGILIGDQAANSAANSVYDLIVFDADPSGTTFTENAALDVADLNKIIGVVRFDGVAGSTLFTNADNEVIFKAVEIPIQASGSANLFCAMIARGAPTYAATTDVFLTFQIEQN
jgi:hypothetical protein